MRAVLQRVSKASVIVEEETVGEIARGLMVLLGVHASDTMAQVQWLAEKLVGLRIFQDDQGKMNRSLEDIEGSMLVVSQFTLYGDTRKGRRPSFIESASPEIAIPLYEAFMDAIRAHGVPVQSGRFGATMQVELINDGPVTLIVDTP